MKSKITMVRRACPVCLSRDESKIFAEENFNPELLNDFAFSSRKIPENMHYRLVICPVCNLLYSNPLPTLKNISKGYQEAAYDSSEEAHFAARTYARFLPILLKNLPDENGALDIGTGDGAFLEELLKMGFKNVLGVEPSKAPILASLPSIRPLIRQKLFTVTDYKKNSLSLVTCFQTIEHLYDPMKICCDIYKILKDQGAFFTVCHNRNSLSAKLLGMKSPIYDMEHLQLFSVESARFMMEKAGFAQIEIRSIWNSYPLTYWLKLLPIPLKLKLSLMTFLNKSFLGRLPIPLPAGNLAVIGYKKAQ